jgi:branched-chain amino acid transport system ATP-binding protein
MSLLRAENISLSFGGLTAVNDFNFYINEGQVVSIIGPNGAGKTTLFNILTGIYKVNQGKIYMNEEPIDGLHARKIVSKGIARTFQNIRLFSDMRVIENVLVGAHINTDYSFFDGLFRTKRFYEVENKKKQEGAKLLESLGLAQRLSDYADNLSYGEQRKLEIARAMATGAKLLLLDEPAAGMNHQESEDLRVFISNLKNLGYTILLIEHDMRVVMNVSDYIYVMDYGKKIAEGRPHEIQSNEAVAMAYLGDSEVHL